MKTNSIRLWIGPGADTSPIGSRFQLWRPNKAREAVKFCLSSFKALKKPWRWVNAREEHITFQRNGHIKTSGKKPAWFFYLLVKSTVGYNQKTCSLCLWTSMLGAAQSECVGLKKSARARPSTIFYIVFPVKTHVTINHTKKFCIGFQFELVFYPNV